MPSAPSLPIATVPIPVPTAPSPVIPISAQVTRAAQDSSPRSETRAESGAFALSGNKLCPTCGQHYPDDFNVCPRDATPLTWDGAPDVDPFLGTVLADTYRVVSVIGEGGMGRVYEVHHARLPHRRFALKMLHPEFARNPDIVTRFSREAEAASKIEHPNVIDVYDVGRSPDGRPYLVSELLSGEELGSVATRLGKIEVGMAVHLVRQVCRALGAAHEHDVVHRDMKPENLFLIGDPARPTVKVIDFGISKVGDHGPDNLTRTGVVMGTPAYMAPEQARGERVDHRADIYATGAILYRLLTGRTPFATEDATLAMTAVLTEEPPRPRSIASEIPEALEVVIERAMAKKPDDRWKTMAELEAALLPFDPWPTAAPGQAPLSVPAATASGPTDPGARTVLVRGAPQTISRATREAQLARPLLVGVSLVGAAGVYLGTCDAIGGGVMLLTHDHLSPLNAVLLMVGVFAAGLTPLVLFVRHVWRNVWGSTVRAIAYARKLSLGISTGLSVYGGLSLLVRFVHDVAQQAPRETAWPGWSGLLFGCGVVAALFAVLLSRLGER